MPPARHTFRAALFDMDGTLLDTERISWKAWQRGAQELGIDLPLELYQRLIGRTRRDGDEILRELAGGDDAAGRLRERTEFHYRAALTDPAELRKAGARELLHALHQRGIPLAVATSSERELAERKLTLTELRPYLQHLIGGNDVDRGKPDPEPFRKAAAGLGVAIEDCLIFEDSVAGLQSALAAGGTVVAIPDLQPVPDALLAQAAVTLDATEAILPWIDAHTESSPPRPAAPCES
jgi:HAD superfamily hydrolase (TIGR01509 family)